MQNRIAQAIMLASAFVMLTGCATSGNKALLNPAIEQSIVVGATTKQEVRALLGEPTVTARHEVNGKVRESWGYGYAESWTNPLLWVPGINLIVFICCETYRMDNHSLGLSFSDDGIVASKMTSRTDVNTLMPTISVNTSISTSSPPL